MLYWVLYGSYLTIEMSLIALHCANWHSVRNDSKLIRPEIDSDNQTSSIKSIYRSGDR
ncbi:hypothetical protein GO730_20280 [Spirosoma sp. HMF3257]|uniref:hypothetical protein n=1 Tax=Spirosoma telluris TaxID=2183553 RepID=UPI0012F9353D|nr:hypothetical protein [Spirosoma telluris]